jgi:uncharacterized protein YbjT (DUF2867 family)
MQVLVAGATSLLGAAIVSDLRASGYTVRAMVRTGRGTTHLRDTGATLEFGDLGDLDSLRRACRGAQALVIAPVCAPFGYPHYANSHGEGVRRLIAAARQSGVPQIVLLSTLKADEAASVPALADAYMSELFLRGAGLCYTILRPSSLYELFGACFSLKWLLERYRIALIPGRNHRRHSFVAARDVARATRLVLERREAACATVEIGGPDDLSFDEAYARIAHRLGNRVTPLRLSERGLRLAAPVLRPIAPELRHLQGLPTVFDRFGYTCVTPTWLVDALGSRRCFDERIGELYTCS